MGGLFSSFSSPTLATPVKVSDLKKEDKTAIDQFRSDYRSLGFAVLEMNENWSGITNDYREICGKWFNENNFAEKKKYIAESKDALFKELGRRPNIGYILTEHKKEYLKFKNSSNEDMFPTKQIYTKFKELYKIWEDAAMLCMETVLSEPVKIQKKQNNINDMKSNDDDNDDNDENEEKLPEGFETLTTKEDRDNVRKFGGIHSSISLLHYFNKKCDIEEEEKLDSSDDRLKNRTKEIPLGKHVDTGLMTFITCSDIAGLQILDRKTNKYFHAETCFDSTKHIFVIAGRKMELFTWKSVIKPTWHAVKIPLQMERNSLLYFMEIQKDH